MALMQVKVMFFLSWFWSYICWSLRTFECGPLQILGVNSSPYFRVKLWVSISNLIFEIADVNIAAAAAAAASSNTFRHVMADEALLSFKFWESIVHRIFVSKFGCQYRTSFCFLIVLLSAPPTRRRRRRRDPSPPPSSSTSSWSSSPSRSARSGLRYESVPAAGQV